LLTDNAFAMYFAHGSAIARPPQTAIVPCERGRQRIYYNPYFALSRAAIWFIRLTGLTKPTLEEVRRRCIFSSIL
jgi:hypothetical protein